jgi:hypothetical protein
MFILADVVDVYLADVLGELSHHHICIRPADANEANNNLKYMYSVLFTIAPLQFFAALSDFFLLELLLPFFLLLVSDAMYSVIIKKNKTVKREHIMTGLVHINFIVS